MIAPRLAAVAAMSCALCAAAQTKTNTEDKAWVSQSVALKDTLEAQFIIRVGDVDNLGENVNAVLREALFRILKRHFVYVRQNETASCFGEKACCVEADTTGSTSD